MMRTAMTRALALVVVLAVAGLGTRTASGSSLFDPKLRFRALPTEHFVIYFHQGEDRLAQRLARIAEDTWRALQQPLGVTPPRLTHVVLADQTELANGYATPLPYDTIVLYTVVPSGAAFDFDDWLRNTFTHEFTHIMHLDRSEGWARPLRSIFGRAAPLFPNLFLPAWQIEGLATYEESAITGAGRVHAGEFRAIVGEAARLNTLEPLDRVNGGLTDWPGGYAGYAYGAGFHQYLADRFGADTLATLADTTARRLPYLGSRAFERVYGEPLGQLWREYQDAAVAIAASGPADDSRVTRLTHDGFSVSGPRFDRVGDGVIYSAANPQGFPSLRRVDRSGGAPLRLATRVLGSTAAIGRDRVYFDQIEAHRNSGLYSDLYEWSRTGGRVRRLTSSARLQDPDLSPDETTLVCTRNHDGQRDLVLVRLKPGTTSVRLKPDTTAASITTLVAEPDTQFDAPKWAPDGRTIAVERHRLGALSEVIIVDLATKAVRVVAAAPHTRFVTPAWRPDGAALIVAAAPGDETFNLVEFSLDGSTARQLTRTTGGARWPDVSGDGKTIVFVGYTTGGDDLFTIDYPAEGAGTRTSLESRGIADTAPPAIPVSADLPAHVYSPLSTMKPTSWMPVVESGSDQVRASATISGFDVLGYHAYTASASWLVSGPVDSPRPNAATPDWQVFYVYGRWQPSLFVTATSKTSFFAGPATAEGSPTPVTLREREVEAGVLFPIRHIRLLHAARLSVVRAVDDYTLAGGGDTRTRTAVRAAWQTITAHTYGYSISREAGIAAGATTEMVRRGLGSSSDATTSTGDFRGYFPGLAAHHVVAIRLAGGASIGETTAGRTFLLGGSSPGLGVADIGSSAFALLRGFPADTFAGNHVAVLNAEYRWPIARPQRGLGTWPIFVHSIHAAVFADTGHAWTTAFRSDAIKSSAGAQLSADCVAGYFTPFTATLGAAWGHDRGGLVADRVTLYFRIGKAF